jgi:hypothetical protein
MMQKIFQSALGALDSQKLKQWEPFTVLNALIYSQSLFGVILMIAAFSVSGTANVGFNIVLTSLLDIAYPVAAYYAINIEKSVMATGATVGAGVMMIFITLMTAIYWGNLSVCEKTSDTISGYSCSQRIGYRSICIFSILLLGAQSAFTLFLITSRNDILDDAQDKYEEIVGSVDVEDGTSKQTAPSADL